MPLTDVAVMEDGWGTACFFSWTDPVDLLSDSLSWVLAAVSMDGERRAELCYERVQGKFAAQYLSQSRHTSIERRYKDNAQITKSSISFQVPVYLSKLVGTDARAGGFLFHNAGYRSALNIIGRQASVSYRQTRPSPAHGCALSPLVSGLA